MKKTIEKIEEKITELVKSLKETGRHYFYIAENSDSRGLVKEIIKMLSNSKIAGRNTSAKYIGDRLSQYLLSTIRENKKSPIDFINEMMAFDQQEFPETKVYLPISGAHVSKEIELFNSKVLPYDESLRDQIISSGIEVIKINPLYSDKEKDEQIAELKKYILPSGDFLVLCHEASKNKEKVIEEAGSSLENLLVFLNFISLIESDPQRKIMILPGTTTIDVENRRISTSKMNISFFAPIFQFDYRMPLDNLLNNKSYKRIHDIMQQFAKNKNITYTERKVIDSISWASNANLSFALETRYLNLITAIETLIPKESQSTIGTTVAEGIAFLLREDSIEQKDLFKTIKHFYNKRGALSHGSKEEVRLSEYIEILEIYIESILYFIEQSNAIHGEDALRDKIQNRKFGIK